MQFRLLASPGVERFPACNPPAIHEQTHTVDMQIHLLEVTCRHHIQSILASPPLGQAMETLVMSSCITR